MVDWKYYTFFGLVPRMPDSHFRVRLGVYQDWDAKRHAWVTNDGARNFYSRAIENGDDVVPMTPSEVGRTEHPQL